MPYQPNKPLPNDDLDVSVDDLQQNFEIANTVMSIDHYPFDNLTANKGFHKKVTSPDQGSAPAVTVNAQLFGWQQTANLGTIQYSKRSSTSGDANPVPSPITYIQSLATPIAINFGDPAVTMFDFTGLSIAIFGIKVLVINAATVSVWDSTVMWDGTNAFVFPSNFGIFTLQTAGPLLKLFYAVDSGINPLNVVWTLIPYRLQ